MPFLYTHVTVVGLTAWIASTCFSMFSSAFIECGFDQSTRSEFQSMPTMPQRARPRWRRPGRS